MLHLFEVSTLSSRPARRVALSATARSTYLTYRVTTINLVLRDIYSIPLHLIALADNQAGLISLGQYFFLGSLSTMHGEPTTTMSLRSGVRFVSICRWDFRAGFDFLELLFCMYAAYSAASPHKFNARPQANTIFHTMLMTVRCIRLALPLLAWLRGSPTCREIAVSLQKTPSVWYSSRPSASARGSGS